MERFAILARNRIRIIKILTTFLIFQGLVNFYFLFEINPSPNDECIWFPISVNSDSTVYEFRDVKFEGAAWNAGIRDGDHLIKINGIQTTDPFTANNSMLTRSEGNVATYLVSRDGNRFETKVEFKRLINFNALAVNLVSIFWLMMGYVVIVSKPEGKSQRLFYKIGVSGMLFSLICVQVINGSANPIYFYPVITVLIDLLQAVGMVWTPFLIINFFLHFPREVGIIHKKIFKKIFFFTPIALYVLLLIYKVLFLYNETLARGIASINFQFSVFGILFVISVLLSSIFLIRGYLKIESKRERSSVFVIIIASIIAIVSVIYTATLAPAIATNIYNDPQYFAPIFLIVLIPISFGYSIFRYSLMDVSDVVKNTILYGLATIAIAAVYFLTIYILGQWISQALTEQYQAILAGMIFIIFAVIFQSSKDRIQELITRKFYPEQFAFQNVLVKFSKDINTIVGLENILDSANTTFVDSLNLQNFGIILRCEESGHYKFMRTFNIEHSEKDIFVNDSAVLELMKNKEKQQLPQVLDKSEFAAVVSEGEIEINLEQIYTILPLINKDNVLGFLFFSLKRSGAQFAGKDLELLSASANQLSASIENARLYESEAEKMQMERDLDNARAIQSHLLPKAIPSLRGLNMAGIMTPANHVGGDYYDFITTEKGNVFIIVGDVSGKGLSASFYMSKLQTIAKLYCKEGKSPREIIIEMNKQIFGQIDRSWFITVSLAYFDTKNKKMSLVRAGHTPTYFITGNKIQELKPDGIGVGLEKGVVFEKALTQLDIDYSAENWFVFYSDGITEAQDSDKNFYGEVRFKKLLLENKDLETSELMERVNEDLKAFRGSANQNDDITLVLAKSY
ncbi:MAG: SpoIIE family protein phosphatase [Melioribacteraceae bacterium]|nr:SpoIIE family protein phosphatase [Melioribacteraceae bacterium]MCF8411841.1 SpoIIE family protein phosphatase [Melioribacteraceae bacterium]MCF8431804.1 SpoIIE family protein phosphatase [Melioribacteraceae bacterium]